MSYYYIRDEEFLNSKLNKTFVELFRSSDKAFSNWVDELCSVITERWDTKGHPPKSGEKLKISDLSLSVYVN